MVFNFAGKGVQFQTVTLFNFAGLTVQFCPAYSAYQKMMARQRLGQMLSEVDREIAAGTPMRVFEDTFAAIRITPHDEAAETLRFFLCMGV